MHAWERGEQVLREALGNKAYGFTMQKLRGHEGAKALAYGLSDALAGQLQQVEQNPGAVGAHGGKYLVFAARNKTTK